MNIVIIIIIINYHFFIIWEYWGARPCLSNYWGAWPLRPRGVGAYAHSCYTIHYVKLLLFYFTTAMYYSYGQRASPSIDG